MKMKSGLVLLIAALLMAACSTAAPVQEAMEAEVMEADAMEAEVMEDEVMEDDAMETEAMEEHEVMEAEDADSASDGEVMAAEVSFSADVWPIIEQYALNAHGGKGGVFLESYDDIMNYVTAGDPEDSMLYKALTADGLPLMPPDGPLPDEMIQTIYDWIAQGALNN